MLIPRLLTAVLSVCLVSCGYRVAGHADLIPQKIQTIAIPTWANLTNRYTLTEKLPSAVSREFISRTRYRIVTNPEEADAILTGAVVNYLSFPSVSDPQTNRASAVQISVYLQVKLTERQTGKVLFTRPSMEFRQRYEIAIDQSRYFEESDFALDRLSRDVARTLVSSILEAF
ncbi:MAG: hypothetical protein H7Y20_04860 [Bryobacteraceae bacterium]|nr:hypothetical protein [Bryobacteraceae bacterium]